MQELHSLKMRSSHIKKKGKVKELEDLAAKDYPKSSSIGIGHTRWATHGEPNDVNAHPHLSGNGIWHWFITELSRTMQSLKKHLSDWDINFESETDTEVLVHLIEEYQRRDDLTLEDAVLKAINRVVGAFAIVVVDQEDPNKIVAARRQSPLVIGIGEDEFLIASDASPIVKYTNQVVYLNDDELAI